MLRLEFVDLVARIEQRRGRRLAGLDERLGQPRLGVASVLEDAKDLDRDCMVADAVLKNQSAEGEIALHIALRRPKFSDNANFRVQCFLGGPKRGFL